MDVLSGKEVIKASNLVYSSKTLKMLYAQVFSSFLKNWDVFSMPNKIVVLFELSVKRAFTEDAVGHSKLVYFVKNMDLARLAQQSLQDFI